MPAGGMRAAKMKNRTSARPAAALATDYTFNGWQKKGRACLSLALNVIHGAAKVWSLSDQQRTNCAVGLDRLRSAWPLADVPIVLANVRFRGKAEAPSAWAN